MDYRGKKVSVLGLGKSGFASVKLLIRRGAIVLASDARACDELEFKAAILRDMGASVELGGHSEAVFRTADEIVVSPGVPQDLDILRQAMRERPRLPIIAEVELAFRLTKGQIVAVTGSNGKSTTVTLLGCIFEADGREANVVGNIGTPFCDVVESATEETIHVVELSSFQLEKIVDFRPKVACILNLSADHLDRHLDEKAYFRAKERIFMNQTAADLSVLSMDDAKVAMLASRVNGRAALFGSHDLSVTGCFVRDGVITMKTLDGRTVPILPTREMGIPGPHNVSNACAAVACTLPFDVPAQAIARALKDFAGLPHRLEKVGESNGIAFVNDSKATNIESLEVALKSFGDNIVLIAGGYDKGADFSEVSGLVKKNVKCAVLIGDTADKIGTAWRDVTKIERAETLKRAVEIAISNAKSGDVIMLSPGCASFDMFRNFEHRGDEFRNLAKEIISNNEE